MNETLSAAVPHHILMRVFQVLRHRGLYPRYVRLLLVIMNTEGSVIDRNRNAVLKLLLQHR